MKLTKKFLSALLVCAAAVTLLCAAVGATAAPVTAETPAQKQAVLDTINAVRQQNGLAYVGLVLYYGSVVLWVLVLFRMFSRNLYKRQAENQKWLQARSRRRGAASAAKARRADTEHKYFTCKRCKTICRVPVGKGKVIITCPKCGAEIHGKT